LRSRFISQPLAFDALQGTVGPLAIVNAEPDAVAIAEIKFGEIAVKVLLAAVLIKSCRV